MAGGGLFVLVAYGSQNVILSGNPDFTFFYTVLKKYSHFAFESVTLPLEGPQELFFNEPIQLRAKIQRVADLLSDLYFTFTLPDIYSKYFDPNLPGPLQRRSQFQFQWTRYIGAQIIQDASFLIGGTQVQQFDSDYIISTAFTDQDETQYNKWQELVGDVPELYDPANAFDRLDQYPHSISTTGNVAAPSITGKVLTIPLHFWFCETVGKALPLIAMQHSEVEIIVDLKNMFQLFTTLDVTSTSLTYGQRIAPTASMTPFLSPPLATTQLPTNTSLITWNLNPFIECNYIFVSDAEMAHIATTDHSYVINQVEVRETHGQYGPSNDLELHLRNLCTRVAWVCQRNDRFLVNDFDNYTNWENPYEPPLNGLPPFVTQYYSSGVAQSSGITARDILLESAIIIDGKERFTYKQTEFFKFIQNYRHETGRTITDLPGLYTYSFALENDKEQPSGHINGSQFNKTILRNTYVQPPLASPGGNPPSQAVCVLKSTANSPNPTIVNPANYVNNPGLIVTIYRKTANNTLNYTYNVRAFVESYNFLRVIGGIANVVFSS